MAYMLESRLLKEFLKKLFKMHLKSKFHLSEKGNEMV